MAGEEPYRFNRIGAGRQPNSTEAKIRQAISRFVIGLEDIRGPAVQVDVTRLAECDADRR